MPFKSEKQRRFLWAEHPDIAKRWAHEYPTKKKLPMYASAQPDDTTTEDKPADAAKTASVNIPDLVNRYVNNCKSSRINNANTTMSKTDKTADSKQELVDIPHSSKPVYAGEERAKGEISSEIPTGMNVGEGCNEKPKNAINELLTKLSVVLSPHIEQTIENMRAEREGRVATRIPRNRGIKRYPVGGVNILPPMGMAQAPAQSQPAQANNQYPGRPVGGGSHPQFNPINSFGALSTSGVINGNAAFGAKNSPDSSKIAEVLKSATRSEALTKLMDLNTVDPLDVDYYSEEFEEEIASQKAAAVDELENENPEETPPPRPSLLTTAAVGAGGGAGAFLLSKYLHDQGLAPSKLIQPYLPAAPDWLKNMGTKIEEYMTPKAAAAIEKWADTPAWQRSAGKNEEGGLNEKGRKSYEREHGGDLKAPVTQKNPKGKAKKRQHSFCSRMCGMKRVNTGSKTKSDPDSRINKSLRKWNCKCSSATEFGMKLAGGPLLGPATDPNDVRLKLQKLFGQQKPKTQPQSIVKVTGPMTSATPLR